MEKQLTEKQAAVIELNRLMVELGMLPLTDAKVRKMALGVVLANTEAYRKLLAERDAAAEEVCNGHDLTAMPYNHELLDGAQPEALPADDEEASPEVVRAHLAAQFKLYFEQAGGNEKRGLCKALRAIAVDWDGSRKEFLEAAEDMGLNRANAAAEWQTARKR